MAHRTSAATAALAPKPIWCAEKSPSEVPAARMATTVSQNDNAEARTPAPRAAISAATKPLSAKDAPPSPRPLMNELMSPSIVPSVPASSMRSQ